MSTDPTTSPRTDDDQSTRPMAFDRNDLKGDGRTDGVDQRDGRADERGLDGRADERPYEGRADDRQFDGRTDERRYDERANDGQANGQRQSDTGYDHREAGSGTVLADGVTRHDVTHRERESFGGIKVGSAFFGWLTATGTAVLLTALVAAAGTAVGLSTGTDPAEATSAATSDPTTIGIIGAAVLLVVLFIAYYCGGYVAGRMARFDGAKQGVAVWIWALVIAAIVAVVGAVAGDQFNVLAKLNSFPRIPINEGDLSTAGIIAAAGVAVTSLVGAVLGGLAGMRFHRKVDRAGLGD